MNAKTLNFHEKISPEVAILMKNTARALSEKGPPGKMSRFGLCYILAEAVDATGMLRENKYNDSPHMSVYHILEHYGKAWDNFSGDSKYPVPHPSEKPNTAYYKSKVRMWAEDSQYGQNRRDFSAYVANCLERDIMDGLFTGEVYVHWTLALGRYVFKKLGL